MIPAMDPELKHVRYKIKRENSLISDISASLRGISILLLNGSMLQNKPMNMIYLIWLGRNDHKCNSHRSDWAVFGLLMFPEHSIRWWNSPWGRFDPLPCVSVALKYDAVKEERYQQEAKYRDLQRIEEALQLAAQRGETPDSVWPVVDLSWHFQICCRCCFLMIGTVLQLMSPII